MGMLKASATLCKTIFKSRVAETISIGNKDSDIDHFSDPQLFPPPLPENPELPGESGESREFPPPLPEYPELPVPGKNHLC